MRARRLSISNFRGVTRGTLLLQERTLLAGPNGIGKSTICEALDLVLGPERSYRRPIIDEYDFTGCKYQIQSDGARPAVIIEVVLTDLDREAERRFAGRLRRWDSTDSCYADEPSGDRRESVAGAKTDDDPVVEDETVGDEWCLPVVFIGRFSPDDDDFEGDTFFAHPAMSDDPVSGDDDVLGGGLRRFTREDKRQCGFIYLRAHRTGSRALSFGRGSLLDTIARLESEASGPLWEEALASVTAAVLTGSGSSFERVQSRLRGQIENFLSLSVRPAAVDLRVSELTREHLREVLRLFVSTKPSEHAVPFNRLSTGSVNLLVFALLMYIAELKGDRTAIFAMEEPEIALPPHSQRRLVDFSFNHMSQTVVTSHSPYVIDEFDADSLLVLSRESGGILSGSTISLPSGFKPKRYRDNRRQFSEAVLAKGVLIVEGATEVAVLAAVSDALERFEVPGYFHVDHAGITLFDAKNDTGVPLYAPVFEALGKKVYGIHDKMSEPLTPENLKRAKSLNIYLEHRYSGIEKLLVEETAPDALRRFLNVVLKRSDYPETCGRPRHGADIEEIKNVALGALKERKGDGYGYAAILIDRCRTVDELPTTLKDFLISINFDIMPAVLDPEPGSDGGAETPDTDDGQPEGGDDPDGAG